MEEPLTTSDRAATGSLWSLHDFVFVKCLGKCSFATVVLAYFKHFPWIMVALKIELKKTTNIPLEFARPLHCHCSIRHKHVVQILGYFAIRVPGKQVVTFLVMEPCLGGTLAEKIKELHDGTNDKTEILRAAIKIMPQVLACLLACHKQGFIHRDVKPENIMFGEDGSSCFT